MTPGSCACKISGPLGIGAVLGEAPVRVIEGGPCYGITYCPTHAAAPEMVAALRATMKAADELMTEFVSKKRAANWGLINQALYDAHVLLAKIEGKE